jgi:tetratricopeptide (TPR) repeat protein
LHLLGLIAHQVGNNDIAVDLITKALAIKPDLAEALNNLGETHLQAGQHKEGLQCLQKASGIIHFSNREQTRHFTILGGTLGVGNL